VSADASYLVNRKLAKSEKEGTRVSLFTRTKRNFSAETLANRAAKKDQKYVLKEERLSTYSFIARDIFVDDVDEEEVESDEVVDGQF
jgi:hypothetical protein